MSFKVGQRVVCIEDRGQKYITLSRGEMYTVRSVRPSTGGIRVKEIILPQTHYGECAHRGLRFRKVDEQFAEQLLSEIEEELNQENLVEI